MRLGLAQPRGSIVNTASMLSVFGGGLVPGYSGSKGGVAQLTKSPAIADAADGSQDIPCSFARCACRHRRATG